ncbi:MAG: hypothetical protein AAF961_11005 [Planctomycetota bacterium]
MIDPKIRRQAVDLLKGCRAAPHRTVHVESDQVGDVLEALLAEVPEPKAEEKSKAGGKS